MADILPGELRTLVKTELLKGAADAVHTIARELDLIPDELSVTMNRGYLLVEIDPGGGFHRYEVRVTELRR